MNSKAKKVLAAVLLVTVLSAGAAYAGGGRRYGGGGRGGWGHCGGGWGGGFGGACFDGQRGGWYLDNGWEVPQEIRDKIAEAQKISIDMRNELGKNPVDRAKVLELQKKRGDIMREVSDWRFQQTLDAQIPR